MLPKPYRLTRNDAIDDIFMKGKKVATPFFVIRIRENHLPLSRLAIIVSKKISKKAVERNLLKRRIRGIIHESLSFVRKGLDIIIGANSNVLIAMSYEDIKKELVVALQKGNLIT